MAFYRPCEDETCLTTRCKSKEIIDHITFAYFAVEMVVKMIALGVFGPKSYLSDTWNILDCFIVIAGALQYIIKAFVGNSVKMTALRTVRVLRPLRAVNRVPSMRIVVSLLLETLPVLGNVLLFCSVIFYLFGIIGVQLWAGMLRQRCIVTDPWLMNITEEVGLDRIYSGPFEDQDYVCSLPKNTGVHKCSDLEPIERVENICNDSSNNDDAIFQPSILSNEHPWFNASDTGEENGTVFSNISNPSCIRAHEFYDSCARVGTNPFQGAMHFDNIFSAWITIFVCITMEGWSDIMYLTQDAHAFWTWIYFFILMIVCNIMYSVRCVSPFPIGAFFMVQMFLVVISCQFSVTKERELQKMKEENSRRETTVDELMPPDEREDPNSIFYGSTLPCYVTRIRPIQQHLTPFIRVRINGVPHVERAIQTDPLPTKFDNFQYAIGNIVESRWFSQVVLVAILLNTVAMGVEHHDQSKELTTVLQYSNYFFTAFFAIEMALKIFGLGFYNYIIDSFNVFDGIIVIVSVIDAAQEGESGGLSVLRTFRLLRIVKLVRFLPRIRRQIAAMVETVDEIVVFVGIMCLLIFIFALLGMVLFGKKFCTNFFTGDPCTCGDLELSENSNMSNVCFCDRMNFDNFANASLTVFQVLTTEDWNQVLFNAMERTNEWVAGLYFVILMATGNFILLNLLIAILVDAMSGTAEEQCSDELQIRNVFVKNLNFCRLFGDPLKIVSKIEPLETEQ